MKTRILILIITLCLITTSTAVAAEKNKAVVQLDAARTAIETMAAKIGVSMDKFDDNFLTVLRNGMTAYAKTLPSVSCHTTITSP